jgi:hypothetical protein
LTDAPSITTYNEQPLHAALKAWYAGPDDRLEVPVDGYVIDVIRDDWLIEIQTANFSSIKSKLRALTRDHRVLLVYPIPREKWLVKRWDPKDSEARVERRKSPKRGEPHEIFAELVSFPDLILQDTFAVEIAWTREEELRHRDKRRGWRRHGWVVDERRLIEVVAQERYETAGDFTRLLPNDLNDGFTTRDLSGVTSRGRRFGQQMAYCLRKMGLIERIGNRGRAPLYARSALFKRL